MIRSRIPSLLTLIAACALVLTGCGDEDNGPVGPQPPSAPTNVQSTVEGTAVTLTWAPGSGASSHRAELTDSGGSTLTQTVGGSDGSATFEDLQQDETYGAQVFAVNSEGEASSSTIDVTVEVLRFNNMLADPMLPDAAFDLGTRADPPRIIASGIPAGYVPFDASTLNGAAGLVMPGDGRTLQATDYPGAVEPGTALTDAWYHGWTVWDPQGADSRAAGASTVTVSGTIDSNTTWTADNSYILDGPVFVGSDCGTDGSAAGCNEVTLTIEPGTTIMGLNDPSDPDARGSFLTVTRGSRIVADAHNPDFGGSGVCERPAEEDVIVFTSDAAPGSRARGDWGGLVLNGQAPLNTGQEAEGEGNSGLYGGPDAGDDSGVLRGVRIEFAGDDVTATDQLNGIAFQGVGAGTTVCYAQVHDNVDDGTEPFGGAVSQTHMVMTGIGDDSFDATDGWQGFLQFGIAQQRGDDADNGFEFSTNADDPGATPPSSAVVANVTLVGAGVSMGSGEIAAEGSGSDVGILLREGANYRVFNTVAVGFGDSGFDVEGAVSAQNADVRLTGGDDPSSTLRLENSVLWSNVSVGGGDDNFADASGDGYTLEENRTFFLQGSEDES